MAKGFLTPFFFVACGLLALTPAQAVVLNWDTQTWTSGSLTQSYDVDPAFAGNDIRITISQNTSNLISGTPMLNNDLTGGLSPIEMALRLQIDIPNRTNFVTVTIDFLNPAGVNNATFSIFDIDVGSGTLGNYSWQDQIRNIGASFGSTTYAPTISNTGSSVTVAGNTVTGSAPAGNATSQGNATISFTAGPVTQIKFDYGGGPSSKANPDNEGIAISDISFVGVSAVPEINAVWVALGALLLGGFIHNLRRNQANHVLTPSAIE